MTFEPIAVLAFLSLGLLGFESVREVIGSALMGLLKVVGWILYAAIWIAVIAGIFAAAMALGPLWVMVLILLAIYLKN